MRLERKIPKVDLVENTIGEVGLICIWGNKRALPLITIKEYAEQFNYSIETVRRHIDEGKLIGIKIGNLWFVQYEPLSNRE